MSTNLSEDEQVRRRRLAADSRAAIAQGQSLDGYLAAHQAAIASFTATTRALMTERGVADPIEILPELLACVQEAAVAEARAAARAAARDEIKALLRKALP